MFKRRPESPIVIEYDSVKFTFRFPTFPETMKIAGIQDLGDLSKVIIPTLVSIEGDSATFEDGEKLSSENMFKLDTDTLIEIVKLWIKRSTEMKAERKNDAEAKEKNAASSSEKAANLL